MDFNTLKAASAYRNNAKMMEGVKPGADDISLEDNKKSSFGDMIENAIKGAADSQYSAEDAKINALTGKTELSDLVTAVSNAELTLNTVVAIRDRVISAYQDILRMPI